MDAPLKQQKTFPTKAVGCAAILAALFFASATTYYVFRSAQHRASIATTTTTAVGKSKPVSPGTMSQRQAADWIALRDMLIQEIKPVDPDIFLKLSQPSSPEWRALQWMFTVDEVTLGASGTGMASVVPATIQRFALVATLMHFGLEPPAKLHECDWEGVGCAEVGADAANQQMVVKALNFSSYSVAGTMPLSLAYVSPLLESLDLSSQRLKGSIQRTFFVNWKKLLYLNLDGNKFTKFFSNAAGEVAALAALEFLSIQSNRLNETVPPSISSWTSLKHVALSGNTELKGRVLEHGLGSWTNIEYIDVSLTSIAGSIPDGTGIKLPFLETLVASNTHLSGRLPESLNTATNLRTLDLGVGTAQNWTGTLPNSYSALTAIETFSIIDLDQITGTLPAVWGEAWTNVQALNMYGCRSVSGSIPTSWGGMTELGVLRLSNTLLSGQIPSELGRLTKLVYLDLAQTKLKGTMPNAVCSLRDDHILSELEADCYVNDNGTGSAPPVTCSAPDCCSVCTKISD